MKKRIISLFLLLSTLLALVPVVGVAAETKETLPKDETPGVISEALPEGAHSFTAYDALYVGADGSKTANGGTLIGLYTAYGDDATVDIAGAKWKNKMDASGATDAVLRDTSDAISFAKEKNGFGYHMVRDQVGSNRTLIGVTFPEAWATLDSYTVEQAATLDAIESTTALAGEFASVRIDLFHGLWIPGKINLSGDGAYCMRWRLDSTVAWTENFGSGQEYAYREAYAIGGKPAGMVTAYTKALDAGTGSVSYCVSYNTGTSHAAKKTYTVEELDAMRASAKIAQPVFSLFNGMSGSFYAVRVYDAPLTDAEKQHNAVVDILAYAGADASGYAQLTATSQAVIDKMLGESVFDDSKENVEKTMNDLLGAFSQSVNVADTLYVTEGLTFFASAYTRLWTGSYGTGTINWLNAVDPGECANLRGGFYANEKGGYTIVKDAADVRGNNTDPTSQEFSSLWGAHKNLGIYMPASALPDEDYTVEIVYNPVGITEKREDGTIERYIDILSSSGNLFHGMGMALGPFRASLHASVRTSASGSLEKRWFYSATKDLVGMEYKADYYDQSWAKIGMNDVMSYTITHDYNAGSSVYNLYNNTVHLNTLTFDADEYVTPDEAGNKFQLMLGVAGTAYSVRVYDRTLTEEEIAKNRFADLVYYYDLDPTLVLGYVRTLGDDANLIYDAYADMPFTYSKEEAAGMFFGRLADLWISYEGVGVRKDAAKDGIRYYFDCYIAAAEAMVRNGYQVEIGALVNVDKNIVPTLEGYAYDYKIRAYDSDGGKNTPFFVDEDTFAITLLYENLDKKTGLTDVLVCGYVKLIDAEGTETVYYVNPETDKADVSSLFSVYDYMKDIKAVKNDAATLIRVRNSLEKCYEHVNVYVNAGVASGGDGSKDAPFHSFADGFSHCKDMIKKESKPTRYVLRLADGEYGVYETQTLTADDMPYGYVSFEITSEGGKTTLTTTKTIDKTFTKYANNVWVCQLDKDVNGEYPCFRTLYVDGKLADVAYSTDRYSVDDNPYLSKYDQSFAGPWGRAYDLYKTYMLTAASKSGYERADLDASFEAYKEKFLALMDMEGQHTAKKLVADSVPTLPNPSATYLECFEKYKLTRLALDEMKKWHDDHPGTSEQKASDYGKLQPSRFTDHEGYVETFKALQAKIKADGRVGNWSEYKPMVETDAIEKAKYYLHEDVVGDLRAEMAAGRERQEAAYAALLAKYNAADAAGKAELEDDLALAAEKVADATWYRHALEGYGPEMRLNGQWWANIIHVAGVDYEDTVVDEKGNTHIAVYLELDEYVNYQIRAGYSNAGRYVCMQDALGYVDSADEYYYDELSGKLYYYNEGDPAGKTFARGTNDYMFVFRGVKNVLFTDLTFTGMDDDYLSHNDGCTSYPGSGADGKVKSANEAENHAYDRSVILLDSCYGMDIYGCDFLELPVRAIFGKGVLENITIDSCSFVRLGSNAIHFGDATAERNWRTGKNHVEDVVITNNYLYDIGRVYFPSAGIWVHYGRNLSVTHNTVNKVSWSAIALGFTYSLVSKEPDETFCNHYNVDVSYNYVSGFMQNIGDGGGIYLTGGNAPTDREDYFNYVHHNYVLFDKGTGDGLGHMVTGIYFDGAASNWKCYENVVVEQSYGAVVGEDDGFDLSDEEDTAYLTALRNRYRGSTFIYMQHIMGQITHNNLLDNNYIVNVRATEPEKQKVEVYKTYIVADRNIVEQNTHYITSVDRIPANAENIIYATGASGHEGDPNILYGNDY